MSDTASSTEHVLQQPALDAASLRNMVRCCRVPMAVFNLETRLIDCVNEAFADMFGYSREELAGRSPAMLYRDPTAAQGKIDAEAPTVLQTGAYQEEQELLHKDGRVLWCDVQGSLMTTTPVPLALMVLRDISARREAELELSKFAAKFEALIENFPAGVLFTDKCGSLLHANKVAAKMLGQRIAPGTGEHACVRTYSLEREDGSPYDPDKLPIKQVLATGQRAHVDDLFIRRADGTVLQIEEWAVPVSWSGRDGFDAVVALFLDITQRKSYERAEESEQARRRHLHEQLYRDEKMRSIATLAGGVAHDFNNILVSVLGNASLIQSEMSSDHEWYRPISLIVQSAERGAAITKRLLTYSRGGAFSPRRVSLRTVVADSLPLCRSVVSKSVVIEFEARTSEDCVEVDPTQMQQILLNLTLNAAEAMPFGGSIQIVSAPCSSPEDTPLAGNPCVCLCVKDQGQGVKEELADKIFDPFFTTKEFGRGLGLASVYGMLKKHGAEIHLISKPGEGAEFRIYFPLCTSQDRDDENEQARNSTG